jgi:hypothetical protein
VLKDYATTANILPQKPILELGVTE